jgi:DNA-binding MarR family transcriptional regulator
MTQRDLTTAMSSDPNTVASLVERMAEAGWIERRRHERDGRAYRISALPQGRAKYSEVRSLAIRLQAEVLSVLPPDEQEHFLAQLELVADACRQSLDSQTAARS